MDIKDRKKILKWWAESKAFEFFTEDIEKLLNKNRDSLATLDLFDESQRAKWVKIQANINAVNDVLAYIKSYSNESRVSWWLDISKII